MRIKTISIANPQSAYSYIISGEPFTNFNKIPQSLYTDNLDSFKDV